jgi:hypothetical protein
MLRNRWGGALNVISHLDDEFDLEDVLGASVQGNTTIGMICGATFKEMAEMIPI